MESWSGKKNAVMLLSSTQERTETNKPDYQSRPVAEMMCKSITLTRLATSAASVS